MIKNESTIHEEHIDEMRSALEHRATWFYLLLDEARKHGVSFEELGRPAIYRCGCFHGDVKKAACIDSNDMREFAKVFADDTYRKIFEMEMKEVTENEMNIDFHYCPLVAAWIKAGAKEDEIPVLCDIAMEGDRGVVSRLDGYEFKLDGTIAEGKPICGIRVKKA